jgi:hypothetical protein
MGSTESPIQWVTGACSLGVKRPGREADYSPPASAEVKKIWIYISTPHTPSWRLGTGTTLPYLTYLTKLLVSQFKYMLLIKTKLLILCTIILVALTDKGKKGKAIPVRGRGGP